MAIGWIVFALVFGSALLAMFVHSALPEHHLSMDSKDVVKLGIAVIATMSALVVSLLLASAKGSYDARSREFTKMSANIILLDRLLTHYGPETKEVRDLLHRSVVDALDRIGSSGNFQLPILARTTAAPQSIYHVSPCNVADCAGVSVSCTMNCWGDICHSVARIRTLSLQPAIHQKVDFAGS